MQTRAEQELVSRAQTPSILDVMRPLFSPCHLEMRNKIWTAVGLWNNHLT